MRDIGERGSALFLFGQLIYLYIDMKKWPFLLLSGILSLLATGCRTGGGTPVYDVVVVGGGPAGIGAALAAAETGARTALLERDSRVGGTTVQAEVCDMGLFYAWRRPIITGPGWEMVRRAVAEAGGTLPDFSRQEPDKWMESCVRVDPVVYARVAEETLRQAGVELFLETEVLSVEKTKKGWRVGKGEMLPTDVHVGMSWFIRKGGG
jgi:flavin-dependent dehydrogenase